MPGRGNSSPIVWGDRIFLTTGYGNGERLSMLAYSRADGKKLWETFIPQNGVEYVHYKNGFASATPTTDGQLVYASFGRHGLFAFDFNGKIVWQHKFGIIDNYHGPAGSPVLYKDRIFIFQDANPAPGQTGVRRRVRQGDGQADLADAAARIGRMGHRGRHQHRRARRVDREQPVSRGGVRSGERQGAVDRSRQHL